MNDDLTTYAVEHFDAHEWTPSPSATVWRKRYFLAGDREKGAVTSVVRYDEGSDFPTHGHPEGEEILVLEGVFSDEHGDFPAGTFFLNPPGTVHAPGSADGCIIFVRLRQYGGEGRPHLVTDLNDEAAWEPHPEFVGVERLPVFADDAFDDTYHFLRMDPGTTLPELSLDVREELFVVDGDLDDEHGSYRKWSWVRYPAGTSHTPHTTGGCTLLVRKTRN